MIWENIRVLTMYLLCFDVDCVHQSPLSILSQFIAGLSALPLLLYRTGTGTAQGLCVSLLWIGQKVCNCIWGLWGDLRWCVEEIGTNIGIHQA